MLGTKPAEVQENEIVYEFIISMHGNKKHITNKYNTTVIPIPITRIIYIYVYIY